MQMPHPAGSGGGWGPSLSALVSNAPAGMAPAVEGYPSSALALPYPQQSQQYLGGDASDSNRGTSSGGPAAWRSPAPGCYPGVPYPYGLPMMPYMMPMGMQLPYPGFPYDSRAFQGAAPMSAAPAQSVSCLGPRPARWPHSPPHCRPTGATATPASPVAHPFPVTKLEDEPAEDSPGGAPVRVVRGERRFRWDSGNSVSKKSALIAAGLRPLPTRPCL